MNSFEIGLLIKSMFWYCLAFTIEQFRIGAGFGFKYNAIIGIFVGHQMLSVNHHIEGGVAVYTYERIGDGPFPKRAIQMRQRRMLQN